MTFGLSFGGLGRLGVVGGGGGGGGGGASAFDFNPATAKYIYTGDSIAALDDDTGFIYGWAVAGAPYKMPPYSRQAVSGSEINEGASPSTNSKDLLYTTRKQILIDAVQPGDVVGIAIGTNTIGDDTTTDIIAGLKELYAALIDAGAFIEAWTVLPSASNISNPDLATVNSFITSLDVSGFTSAGGTFYPASKFCVIDGFTAWGGTYVGNTDSGNLHCNVNGAILLWRAKRDKYKAIGRAYCPLAYGTTNPSGNLLTNWNLAAGTAGTLTGTGNTLTNNGVPTGIAVACTANAGLTIQTDIISSYTPNDSLFSGVAAFPVLKITVTGTAALQADITITMSQAITSEPSGSTYEASCYMRVKGVGVTDPTGLLGFGATYGSTVSKWASQNTNYSLSGEVTKEVEGIFRGRQIPAVATFGTATCVETFRVRNGGTASFEIYFGQPYAAKTERTAYATPKNLATDQDSIGGQSTGPQVGSSAASWTATSGATVTGRVGTSWRGGGITFQFTWEKDSGGSVTTVSGPTTVTTTTSTTQYTIAGVSGDKFRLKVTATNSFGSADAYSVWSSALP